MRATFGRAPGELRRARRGGAPSQPGEAALRLPYRAPLDVPGLLGFLGLRAVPGVEEKS